MHRGYIKLFRRLQDSTLWTSEKFTRGQAWVDLLILANHKDGYFRVRGQRVYVKRGQVGWSQKSLAARWKWSRGKIRRFLSEISGKTEHKIVQQKSNLTTLITILNWERYQTNGTVSGPTDGTPNGHQTDTKRYTNKNDKNVKNDKKISTNGARPIPKDFSITDQMTDWFTSQHFKNIEIKTATEEFVDYWLGTGKHRKDWIATWRNGMRKREEWAANKQAEGSDAWKNF